MQAADGEATGAEHKIRITLTTSKSVANLEKVVLLSTPPLVCTAGVHEARDMSAEGVGAAAEGAAAFAPAFPYVSRRERPALSPTCTSSVLRGVIGAQIGKQRGRCWDAC